MNKTIKARIEIECGSEFQYDALKRMLEAMMIATKHSAEEHHKQNKVTYTVK